MNADKVKHRSFVALLYFFGYGERLDCTTLMEMDAFVKNRWRGFKFMLVGMAVAIFGFAIVWFLKHWTGWALFAVGFGAGVVGFAIHARQVVKEFKADPKDLYPREKQPWEQ